MASKTKTYHHGNLKEALISAGLEILRTDLEWILRDVHDNRDIRATARYYLNQHYAQKGAEKKREAKTEQELPY